ncbi:hypothetical protein BJX76DRAFT_333434 [Aspergillus varians]
MTMQTLFGGVDPPAEISDKILEFVFGGTVLEGNYSTHMGADWLLINRAWHDHTLRFIYSRFDFDGHPNRLHCLWNFLQMIVIYPERAAMVKHLHLTHTERHERLEPKNLHETFLFLWRNSYGDFSERRIAEGLDLRTDKQILDHLDRRHMGLFGRVSVGSEDAINEWYHHALYVKNRAWLEKAFTNAGFDQGPNNLKILAENVLNKGTPSDGYQCPLTALILAHCPSLRGLAMEEGPEDLKSPWLDRIVGYALGRQTDFLQLDHRPLQMLDRLDIRPAEVPSATEGALPFYRLPQLVEFLGNLGKSTRLIDSIEEDLEQSASNIEILSLRFVDMAHGIEFPTTYQRMPKLRQITLSLHSAFHPGQAACWLGDLGSALEAYKNQLEYLEIYYYDPTDGRLESQLLANRPFCCPLYQFPKLRHLNISPLLLVGNDCPHPSPVKLRSHLPPNIESLGLYTSIYLGTERRYIKDISRELAALVADDPETQRKSTLRAIVFDNQILENFSQSNLSHETRVKRMKTDVMLRDAAIAKGITYHREGKGFLFYVDLDVYHNWLPGRPVDVWQRRCRMHLQAEQVIPRGMKVYGTRGKL